MSFYNCNSKSTNAQIEVERYKSEIERIDPKKNLTHYRNILSKIENQQEIDRITISLTKDYYNFLFRDVFFSGEYNIEKNIIEQRHHAEAELTEDYKKTIHKWIIFSEQNNIFGFEKGDSQVTIFIKPYIYLLFFNKDFNKANIENYIKIITLRGDFVGRLADDVFVATERR